MAALRTVSRVHGRSFLTSKEEIEQWRVDGAAALARAVELGDDPDRSLAAASLLSSHGANAAAVRVLEQTYALTDDEQERENIARKLADLHAEDVRDRAKNDLLFIESIWRDRWPFLPRTAVMLVGPGRDTLKCAGHEGSSDPAWCAGVVGESTFLERALTSGYTTGSVTYRWPVAWAVVAFFGLLVLACSRGNDAVMAPRRGQCVGVLRRGRRAHVGAPRSDVDCPQRDECEAGDGVARWQLSRRLPRLGHGHRHVERTREALRCTHRRHRSSTFSVLAVAGNTTARLDVAVSAIGFATVRVTVQYQEQALDRAHRRCERVRRHHVRQQRLLAPRPMALRSCSAPTAKSS